MHVSAVSQSPGCVQGACCAIAREWQNRQVGRMVKGGVMTVDVRLALEPVGARSHPVHVPNCKVAFYACFLHFAKLQGMEEKGF